MGAIKTDCHVEKPTLLNVTKKMLIQGAFISFAFLGCVYFIWQGRRIKVSNWHADWARHKGTYSAAKGRFTFWASHCIQLHWFWTFCGTLLRLHSERGFRRANVLGIVLVTLNECPGYSPGWPDEKYQAFLLGGRVCEDKSWLARRKFNGVIETIHIHVITAIRFDYRWANTHIRSVRRLRRDIKGLRWQPISLL